MQVVFEGHEAIPRAASRSTFIKKQRPPCRRQIRLEAILQPTHALDPLADEPARGQPIGHPKHHKPSCFRQGTRSSLVISNIETTFLPSNTASSFSSARMLRLSLGSWSSCLRTYSQSFLVSSVRGSGSLPTLRPA